ncbi:MAG: Crp/Fnr family transcriptional regulator, partial [Candidatus Sericytochromatia bacterium]|nr:Crp/Fnr family transcriptional regulator [Candidatus Sericytochromatia bacterium]
MDRDKLIFFLKEVPLLEALDDHEFEQLSNQAIIKEVEKGKTILHEYDNGTSLYIIVKGKVKVFIASKDAKEHVLGFLGAKEFFGEISLLDGEPRSTSVTATEKTSLIVITRENFAQILRNNPDVTYKIILSLCTKIRWTDRHVGNLAFLSAFGKVARTVMNLADEIGIKDNNKIIINHNMTRQDFANIAGTSRETMTRVLIDLE